MTNATQTTPTCKALVIPCPCCNEQEAGILVALHTLDEESGDNFQCSNCENWFSLDNIRDFIRKWTRVLAWLAMAPDLDAD